MGIHFPLLQQAMDPWNRCVTDSVMQISQQQQNKHMVGKRCSRMDETEQTMLIKVWTKSESWTHSQFLRRLACRSRWADSCDAILECFRARFVSQRSRSGYLCSHAQGVAMCWNLSHLKGDRGQLFRHLFQTSSNIYAWHSRKSFLFNYVLFVILGVADSFPFFLGLF